MTFSEQQINKWKEALEEEKNKLEKEIGILGKTTDFGNDVDGFEEEADETEELINKKGASFVLEGKLRAIRSALKKISDGTTFGLCEQCENAIESDILDIDPESHLCKSCKQKN